MRSRLLLLIKSLTNPIKVGLTIVSILTRVRFLNSLFSSKILQGILNSLALLNISNLSPTRGSITIVTLLILSELVSK